MTVGYEPLIDAAIPLEPSKDRSSQDTIKETTKESMRQPAERTPALETGHLAPLGSRRPLRFGGLSLDTLTGRVVWGGRSVPLAEEETELLEALMRNAGRIVSADDLAADLADSSEGVERRVRSLHGSLSAAGVRALPRRASGLGYILWR